MKMETIHVYIEYRFVSRPGESPADKLLRARVRMPNAEGWDYGCELIAPRRITELWKAEQACVEKLARYCSVIVFEYDPRLGQFTTIRRLTE
jgi:hypothetical protein